MVANKVKGEQAIVCNREGDWNSGPKQTNLVEELHRQEGFRGKVTLLRHWFS